MKTLILKNISYIIYGLVLFVISFGFSQKLDALTGYTRTFDGGVIVSVITECTCSGGTLIEFESYVDYTTHQYIYQPGITTLYQYYNIFTSGNYFLSTHYPVGICLVVSGNSCVTEGNPEGTLTKIGSSLSQ